MKRFIALILTVLLVFSLAACGESKGDQQPAQTAASDAKNTQADTPDSSEKVELVVFAAASMTETLSEIAELYKSTAPDVSLTFNFDSSGTLKTQIEEGAVCDLFISAAQKQMDGLEKGGCIDTASRTDLLENKVALCKAENSGKDIKSYDDMKAHLEAGDILMAIGNEDVPVGQYTQKIFRYYGLDEAELNDKGVLTYGSNVKEVAAQISEGAVDCGIIYQTDAYSAGLTVADTATEEMCGRVVYPAAVLKDSRQVEAAKAFLDFLKTKEASDIFSKVGFTPLS